MLLNTAKISDADTQRLRSTLKTRKLLNTVKDYAFLCKDLELFENNPVLRKELEEKASFTKNLGNFLSPAFELGEGPLDINYIKTQAPKSKESLKFWVGSALNWKFSSLSGISFFVTQENSNRVLFWEGPYPNSERNIYPYTQKKLIFKLANYFYNRRPLYGKIYKILLENKAELEAKTSKEFAEDLTLLFSVKNVSQNIPDFSIEEANLKERSLLEFWQKEARETIGSTSCYLKKEKNGYKSFSKLRIEISLNNNNELRFVVAEGWSWATPKTEEPYSDMKEILLARTNDFLKQVVASTNFAATIYEKVKVKILLKNI